MTLAFTEPVTPVGGGLTVMAPSGRRASRGTARASNNELTVGVDAVERGTYRVSWELVAQDTHPSRGSYTFSVGNSSPAPPGLDVTGDIGDVAPAGLAFAAAARWAHLLGMALAFGVIFHAWVTGARDPRLERLVTAGLVLLVLAEPLALAGQSIGLAVAPVELTATAFGRVLALRLGGALLLWAGLGAIKDADGRGQGSLAGLGLAVALVDGASAHRIAAVPGVLSIALSGVHEAAMAVWVGGVAAMALTRGVGGFARIAGWAFAVLTVTGLVMAVSHLRAPADLLAPGYGLVLLVKLLAVAAAAILGLRALRRWEAGALVAVTALAALLVSLPPPR